MRKLIATFLLSALLILPILTSCVPSGYEEGNPNRPDDNQVNVDDPEPGSTPPDAGAPAEEDTGE